MKNVDLPDYPVLDSPDTRTMKKLDLLDLCLVVLRRRRLVLLATGLGLLAGVVTAMVLKPSYIGAATILPPQQAQSTAAALIGQLGSLGSLGSLAGGSSLGLKTPSDLYIGMLKSRTISDEIIAAFHLQDVYKEKTMFDLRKRLASHTEIDSGKDGLIHIAVTDHDPNRASELANAYVDDLYKMNSHVAVTEAAQRRVFFDQQVADEKVALQKAEDSLRSLQQRTGLIQLSGQTSETIRSIAERRARIASTQVELQSLLASETEENPDVVRLRRELAELQQQLNSLQSAQGKQVDPGDITLPAGRLPQDSLDYVRQLREVKYHDALYELLQKQEAAARIDEAKSAPIIQVIDRAIPPDKKSGPKRLLISLGGAIGGFILSCLWIFLSFLYENRLPQSAASAGQLRDVVRTGAR